jgi:hypothetical protein
MKHLIAFVAGMFTIAITAAVSGSHTAAVVLTLGFVAGTAAGATAAGSLRRAAARLETIAQWIDGRPAAGPVRVSNKIDTVADPRQAELTSALMNLGSRKPAAAAAARYAIQNAPDKANLPDLVRIALRAPQEAA